MTKSLVYPSQLWNNCGFRYFSTFGREWAESSHQEGMNLFSWVTVSGPGRLLPSPVVLASCKPAWNQIGDYPRHRMLSPALFYGTFFVYLSWFSWICFNWCFLAVLGIFQYKKDTQDYLKPEVLGKQYYIFQHPGGQLHMCMASRKQGRGFSLRLPSVPDCRFSCVVVFFFFFSLQDCSCPVRLVKECTRTEKTRMFMCPKLLGTHRSTDKWKICSQ